MISEVLASKLSRAPAIISRMIYTGRIVLGKFLSSLTNSDLFRYAIVESFDIQLFFFVAHSCSLLKFSIVLGTLDCF